jgi:GH43 family beta-xylosidase
VISSLEPGNGYGAAQQLALPDDKWAVDGTAFKFDNQLWFVWSGWAGDTNIEQNLYIARMSNPTTPAGGRFIISQPREGWERVVGNPFINEAPQAIKDPNGQLHIVYSANGSWSDQYCIADLRLRPGGDPTYVWDWYKSNGCLFGSNPATMIPGFPTTHGVNGPGHQSFVLQNGDINTSPPAGSKFPLMYHGVPKGVEYSWGNRRWYAGGFGWWANITYSRSNVPGANLDTGYSLGLFESRSGPMPPPPSPAAPGQTTIRNQDPSVIRVGSTYYSVESDGNNIYSRSASGVAGLSGSPRTLIWSSPKNMPNVWAPELVTMPTAYGPIYVIYFAAGDGGAGQRTYFTWSTNPNSGYSNPERLNLPDDKWAVDGTAFNFNNQLWFVWSGWEGDTNVEQNLYIARMNSFFEVPGPRFIISQPREGWERVIGNPFINESPEAIKDPSGQLHIVYSANGSWSDQYCIADLRLRAGGDPTYVWDWYKSNGCLFGSHRSNMMNGWDPTLYVNGPGHHSFVLLNGDIGTSPPAGPTFPLMFHAVPKNVNYKWENRLWYHGSFTWRGNITYGRQNVPGDSNNTGWSLKLFE